MAVKMQHICDHPTHGDKEVPGQPVPMILPGIRKPRVVDLCGEHKAQLVDPLSELLTEHGRVIDLAEEPMRHTRPAKAATTEDKEVCGYRGCKEKFPAGQSMSIHRRRKHGIGPKQ